MGLGAASSGVGRFRMNGGRARRGPKLPDGAVHDTRLVEATKHMLGAVIPELADRLSRVGVPAKPSGEALLLARLRGCHACTWGSVHSPFFQSFKFIPYVPKCKIGLGRGRGRMEGWAPDTLSPSGLTLLFPPFAYGLWNPCVGAGDGKPGAKGGDGSDDDEGFDPLERTAATWEHLDPAKSMPVTGIPCCVPPLEPKVMQALYVSWVFFPYT
jgi:hypothetical protein